MQHWKSISGLVECQLLLYVTVACVHQRYIEKRCGQVGVCNCQSGLCRISYNVSLVTVKCFAWNDRKNHRVKLRVIVFEDLYMKWGANDTFCVNDLWIYIYISHLYSSSFCFAALVNERAQFFCIHCNSQNPRSGWVLTSLTGSDDRW